MDPDLGGGADGFFAVFGVASVLIAIGFVVVIGSIVLGVVKMASQAARNRAAPEVTAAATIVDKRIAAHGGGESSVTEDHFVTFQQPSGERFELEVPEGEYGLLVVGDNGTVTMKGTRYLGFAREILR